MLKKSESARGLRAGDRVEIVVTGTIESLCDAWVLHLGDGRRVAIPEAAKVRLMPPLECACNGNIHDGCKRLVTFAEAFEFAASVFPNDD